MFGAFKDRSKFNSQFFVKIYLQKSVPSEAGLGGGSSNAATTLFALNELTHRPFSEEELIDMASKLGADVPLFFSSGSALVSGIGD
ncbi:MAG: 4-(cytidine 5'-diphospho)-2-C-methyl-D-erythritol kinase, partial [Actinobacteria bacterium]|nr:4-(cytidine 5'-diphospho)-2-C-methyl-D-erythritol kinase [Actinomycetota bacterium]